MPHRLIFGSHPTALPYHVPPPAALLEPSQPLARLWAPAVVRSLPLLAFSDSTVSSSVSPSERSCFHGFRSEREYSANPAFLGIPHNPRASACALSAHGQLSSEQDRPRMSCCYCSDPTSCLPIFTAHRTPSEACRCFTLDGVAYAKGKDGTHGDVIF
jgi:hypothetical protein